MRFIHLLHFLILSNNVVAAAAPPLDLDWELLKSLNATVRTISVPGIIKDEARVKAAQMLASGSRPGAELASGLHPGGAMSHDVAARRDLVAEALEARQQCPPGYPVPCGAVCCPAAQPVCCPAAKCCPSTHPVCGSSNCCPSGTTACGSIDPTGCKLPGDKCCGNGLACAPGYDCCGSSDPKGCKLPGEKCCGNRLVCAPGYDCCGSIDPTSCKLPGTKCCGLGLACPQGSDCCGPLCCNSAAGSKCCSGSTAERSVCCDEYETCCDGYCCPEGSQCTPGRPGYCELPVLTLSYADPDVKDVIKNMCIGFRDQKRMPDRSEYVGTNYQRVTYAGKGMEQRNLNDCNQNRRPPCCQGRVVPAGEPNAGEAMNCEEYPLNSMVEGGRGATVSCVHARANSVVGGRVGGIVRDKHQGFEYFIEVVGIDCATVKEGDLRPCNPLA